MGYEHLKAKINNLAIVGSVESDKNWDDWDGSGVQPPSSVTAELERRPVLWLPDGRVLVRTIGFRTEGK